VPLYFPRDGSARRYFQAFKGRHYSLVVTNNTGRRIGVLIAVDGLNVVNGQRSRLSPDEAMYVLDPWERTEIQGLVTQFLPGLAAGYDRAQTCLYTNTPDRHFLVDRHPDHPSVHVVSACSGHGFKFAPVVAEIVADEIEELASPFDLDLFRFRRFARPPTRPSR